MDNTETKTGETAETEETKPAKQTKSPKKAETKSAWDETVMIFLPKAPKTEQNFQFVCVNGRTFQVPKGKNVTVPKPVYEVLINSVYAAEKAEEYENELNEKE